ncbi:MAG: hypothetical protein HY788_08855 [Deltaproteobacteria bacterium]|nr:hypothetical protein [Deltaproteobacteria bacterium]
MKQNNPADVHRFLNVMFVALLFAPMLGMMAGIGTSTPEAFREIENREPASFPNTEWTWSGMAALPEALDRWFSDGFGFRSFLIDLNGRLDVQVLKVSPDPERVVLGRQGWMFLGDLHERVFSKHTGQAAVSEVAIRRFAEDRRMEKEWLQRLYVEYVVVITPDKHTIYPEYLPEWVRSPRPSEAADRAVELLETIGVSTIDLRPALRTAKKDYGDFLYHKTDTHWTELGAYVAYEHAMKGMEPLLGPLKRLEMKNFMVRDYDFGGDLSTMARVDPYVHDHNVFMTYEQNLNTVSACEVSEKTPLKLLWEDSRRNVPRNANVEIINPNGFNDFRVLFMRDSFLTRLTHLFDQSFQQCVYTDETYEQGLPMKDMVTRYRPDIVVFQLAERKIPEYRPKTDARKASSSDLGP